MGKKERINEFTKELLQSGDITDVISLQSMLKEMLKQGVETLLESELDEELGYPKHDKEIEKSNYRNGYSGKTVKSDLGEIRLNIPRDRNNEFEPELVPKHSSDISAIQDKVISMYSKGMSTRDISSHLEELYGIPLSAESVSRMTDKIIPLIEEWQNRPLNSYYAFVFMDAIHYKVKQNNRIVSKAAYVVIGVDEDGYKDVLGLWIGENETSKFWLKVLTDIKNRGVKKVSVFSIDGLAGFNEAIKATYPDALVQRCIIHQIRASARYVNYKHRKEYCKDMKSIYTAVNEEEGFRQLEYFKEKWNSLYPTGIKTWYDNWDVLSPFFMFSDNVRKVMYTTNIIENLNRQYRKVTKGKAVFPSDKALIKSLFLATKDATKKWTMRIKLWDQIKSELSIILE
jgi:transposase-like protein